MPPGVIIWLWGEGGICGTGKGGDSLVSSKGKGVGVRGRREVGTNVWKSLIFYFRCKSRAKKGNVYLTPQRGREQRNFTGNLLEIMKRAGGNRCPVFGKKRAQGGSANLEKNSP